MKYLPILQILVNNNTYNIYKTRDKFIELHLV